MRRVLLAAEVRTLVAQRQRERAGPERHQRAANRRCVHLAGAVAPKHTHPGEEVSYILSGEVVLEIEGSR
jgi:quercetin dioxygenase-like cupin family protein